MNRLSVTAMFCEVAKLRALQCSMLYFFQLSTLNTVVFKTCVATKRRDDKFLLVPVPTLWFVYVCLGQC